MMACQVSWVYGDGRRCLFEIPFNLLLQVYNAARQNMILRAARTSLSLTVLLRTAGATARALVNFSEVGGYKSRPYGCFIAISVSAVFVTPAFADSLQDHNGRLQQFEQVMFGKSNAAKSTDERLNIIESSLFGKAKNGSFGERLDGVGKVLGAAGAPPSSLPSSQSIGSSPSPVMGSSIGSASSSSYAGRSIGLPSDPLSAPPNSAVPMRPDLSREAAGQHINELLRQGLKEYSDNRFSDAQKTFGKVLELDGRNSNAMYNLAAIDEKRGDLYGALRKYELALSFNPDDAELQNTVNSVRKELASSRVSRNHDRANSMSAPIEQARSPSELSRMQAEQQYQSALQQAKASRHGQSPVLQGSASSAVYRPPVASVPVTSQSAPPVLGVEPRSRGMSNAARNAASVGLMVGLGVMSSRVGGLGALHCPICRVLRSR